MVIFHSYVSLPEGTLKKTLHQGLSDAQSPRNFEDELPEAHAGSIAQVSQRFRRWQGVGPKFGEGIHVP